MNNTLSIRTGICANCGKSREHHFFTLIPKQDGFCDHVSRRGNEPRMFDDSGLVKLTEHQEELFEAARNVYSVESTWHHTNRERRDAMNKLESILNQIEKEK